MNYDFVKGCTIGLLYAVPIGPVAVLCLRRTLAENWLSGVMSGVGSATAIALYSIIVVLGINSISDVLSSYYIWLHLLSGIFLCCLGAKIALIRPSKIANAFTHKSYARCYGSTFIFAFVMALPDLTFPVFVLNWPLNVSSTGFYNPIPFSLGVLVSEVTWWLIFCSICWKLRLHLQQKILRWINYASGGMIASFGIITITKSMLEFF
jgi:threonine/homoserine/homoserine lactone efflux protein